jgi:hypothetical protein
VTGLFHVERGLRNEPLVLLAGRPTPIGGASGMFHVERGWRNELVLLAGRPTRIGGASGMFHVERGWRKRAAGWNWEIGANQAGTAAGRCADAQSRGQTGRPVAGAAEQTDRARYWLAQTRFEPVSGGPKLGVVRVSMPPRSEVVEEPGPEAAYGL